VFGGIQNLLAVAISLPGTLRDKNKDNDKDRDKHKGTHKDRDKHKRKDCKEQP
jgi:hypothetical protein